jgi:hypothetical protein
LLGDRFGAPHTVLTIALHGGLYLAIIMHRHERPPYSPTALLGGLYISIIMDRYRGPDCSLTIASEVTHIPHTVALLGGLYLAIIVDRYEVTQTPHIVDLTWRPLPSHYN